jgi:hypothetical protein
VRSDDVWIIDSTPVECGRSRETVNRSDLAGWAQYGHHASHSLLGPAAAPGTHPPRPAHRLRPDRDQGDERETLLDLLAAPHLVAARPGQTPTGDKNRFGRTFEHELAQQGIRLLRPTRKDERQRPGRSLFKPLRQVIEPVNETLNGTDSPTSNSTESAHPAMSSPASRSASSR